jgi:hypothetical protein
MPNHLWSGMSLSIFTAHLLSLLPQETNFPSAVGYEKGHP